MQNPPRHDRDAGGDQEVLAAKAQLREQVWDGLQRAGASRFPGARGRIPNFTGAERAAERLRATAVWRRVRTLKSNPDAPQWPVRQRALEDGKVLYMAAPRLAADQPFFLLDPDHLAGTPRTASSIKGASRSARPVGLDQLEPVDMVVTGCVAVGEDGARLGKGGGFSDLEFALAASAGLIRSGTVVVTTVHERQVLLAGAIPMTAHDMWVDLVVTPERVLQVRNPAGRRRVRGELHWDELTAEKIAAIPLLQDLRKAAH